MRVLLKGYSQNIMLFNQKLEDINIYYDHKVKQKILPKNVKKSYANKN